MADDNPPDGRAVKPMKYMRYAIGEIALIVIGILIALQLNNYNDTLNQNIFEHKALNNLLLDFEYNKSKLEESIDKVQDGKKGCFIILNHTGNKYRASIDLDSILPSTVSTFVYFPRNGFLMDLINSGKLGIIKNDNLRNKLSSWLPTLETLKMREKGLDDFSNDIVRYIINNGSWLNSDEVATTEIISNLKFPKSGFEIDNNDLLQNIEFENMVENRIVFMSILLNRQENCLKLNKEIINLLEMEIKK